MTHSCPTSTYIGTFLFSLWTQLLRFWLLSLGWLTLQQIFFLLSFRCFWSGSKLQCKNMCCVPSSLSITQITYELLKHGKPGHLNALLPVMHTWEAPIALAVIRLTRPMGPAPHTNTNEPKVTPARRQAWTPTLKGSRMAPSSKVTWSGSLK